MSRAVLLKSLLCLGHKLTFAPYCQLFLPPWLMFSPQNLPTKWCYNCQSWIPPSSSHAIEGFAGCEHITSLTITISFSWHFGEAPGPAEHGLRKRNREARRKKGRDGRVLRGALHCCCRLQEWDESVWSLVWWQLLRHSIFFFQKDPITLTDWHFQSQLPVQTPVRAIVNEPSSITAISSENILKGAWAVKTSVHKLAQSQTLTT